MIDYPGGIAAWRARLHDRGEVIHYPRNVEIERGMYGYAFRCSDKEYYFSSLPEAEAAAYSLARSWGEFVEMGI